MLFTFCGRPTHDSWAAGPCSDWYSILVRFEAVVVGLLGCLREVVTFRTCVGPVEAECADILGIFAGHYDFVGKVRCDKPLH